MLKHLFGLLILCATPTLFAIERMVWHDEFNAPKLNLAYWTPEINFVRNIDAVQIYTDRPENLSLTKGSLTLTARHEHFKNTRWNPKSPHWWENRQAADYTSGSINSRDKVMFRYGRIEIRAKIEHGRGVWPALWLIGNTPGGWPTCGEIDILEFVSQNPNTIHATLHYTKNGQYTNPTSPHQTKNAIAGQWHLYGMNWTPEKIELTFDKNVIFTHLLDNATQSDGSNPFRDGLYYLILNLALDGWAEPPVPEDYPRTFTIDYVRLYQDPTIKGTHLEIKKQPPRHPKPRRRKK
ncbi:MAG: glycoside hydrolase family 16 protein [Kiritimatiellae bacterium]|nr:glycoside hydrolase family 16 protein [Kiritimatiellia bacterium]